ncbi:MAG: SUMF1/EgtB/PvdO family nonheme iron enzyme, partial [Planctomycetota bacterium]
KQLPSEAQWEKASRGTQGFVYPWGQEWNPQNCHFNQSGPDSAISVDELPQGASPYGCLNMAGNVWEWCRDYYQDQYSSSLKNPHGPEQALERVIRGGGWSSNDSKQLKTFSRHHLSPDQQLPDLGFRLALEINIPEALDH